MKRIKQLSLLAFLSIIVACSSPSDDTQKVNFISLTADKTMTYIENSVIITIDATDFDDAVVTTNRENVTITKLTSKTYEITSTAATTVLISVELSKTDDSDYKTISLSFYKHGIVNNNTVDGITVDVDNSSKVTTLLGTPDYINTTTSTTYDFWIYTSKGVYFYISKTNTKVNQIYLNSSNFYYTNNNDERINYTNYPHEVGNGLKINDINFTMDDVIDAYGSTFVKSTSTVTTTLRSYDYTNVDLVYSFIGTTEDDYTGKKIERVVVY